MSELIKNRLFALSHLSAAVSLAFALSACGGGSAVPEEALEAPIATAEQAATDAVVLKANVLEVADFEDTSEYAPREGLAVPAAPSSPIPFEEGIMGPTAHFAPALMAAPTGEDRNGLESSANAPPLPTTVDTLARGLSTRGLLPSRIQQASAGRMQVLAAPDRRAAAAGSEVRTYTPAQIRAAYGLPALATATPAQLGAGQTIYVTVAHHTPNLVADLVEFSNQYGLPQCAATVLPSSAALPLAKAPMDRCELIVARSKRLDAFNKSKPIDIVDDLPSYHEVWATEANMDVQWAHAIAPLARIVVIEAASPSFTHMIGTVLLANRMGPGVVSMSWGAPGFSNLMDYEFAFSVPGMTYLAASGDYGHGTLWPAESPSVIAVGGTSLNYKGTGSRTETTWTNSGGDISPFAPVPAHQSKLRVKGQLLSGRAMADVAFNADPYTGQSVAFTPPNGARTWISGGGTSISAPQWAAIFAMASAQRELDGKSTAIDYRGIIYSGVFSTKSSYTSAFLDVKSGSNGSCTICAAASGYDVATGVGTPNIAKLMPMLTKTWAILGLPATLTTGSVGLPYSNQLPGRDAINGSLTYALESSPQGLAISPQGSVDWPQPVAGKHTLKLRASAATGEWRVVPVTLTVLGAPVAAHAQLTVKLGAKLGKTFNFATKASGSLAYTLAGAPAGLSISKTGVLSGKPVAAGTFVFAVSAANAAGGSSSATVTLVVTP